MSGGFLEHPLTRGLALDDPRTTEARRVIVQRKRFLHRLYQEWYRELAALVPAGAEPALELGSGAGFFQEYVDGLITSEILRCSGVQVVLDGQAMPFKAVSLRAVVMTDVLHHVPDVRRFFVEAARCVKVGGALVMVEPWVTPWSRLVYAYLHPEPIVPEAATWELPPGQGPLSGANSALPWIVFSRDRAQFEAEFPMWRIRQIRPTMPFRYVLSGGMTRLSFAPAWSFGGWARIEEGLAPWMDRLAMFAYIVLERTPAEPA